MSDIVDLATGLEAEHLSRSLARISGDIPAGVAGECDECGEQMPRLVGGRCGFCRDGRRPPAHHYPDPASIAVSQPPREEKNVPTPPPTPTARTISVPAKGEALAAIEKRAREYDIALGQAALSIIEDWLGEKAGNDLGTVSTIDTELLIDELKHRFAVASPEQVSAAEARAAAAEAALADFNERLRVMLATPA